MDLGLVMGVMNPHCLSRHGGSGACCGGQIWSVVMVGLGRCWRALPWVEWQVLAKRSVPRVVCCLRGWLLLVGGMLLPVVR